MSLGVARIERDRTPVVRIGFVVSFPSRQQRTEI
jgi:hypothetical protein